MEDKGHFDLGGPNSKRLINWLFWWYAGWTIFSIVGAYYLVPSVVQLIAEGKGWVETICGRNHILDDPITGYWVFLFAVSHSRADPGLIQSSLYIIYYRC